MARRSILTALLLALAACGNKSSPTAPCTDCVKPVQPPSLTCPASISVTTASSSVTAMAVAYEAPRVAEGSPPVTTVCSVASNAMFPEGTTSVSCTATDALGRSAVCSFDVKVTVPAPPIPKVQFTSYLAFGDSLTAGENGCNERGDVCDPKPSYIDTGYEYPAYLEQMLKSRYTQQSASVRNEGRSGESAYTGARYRIASTLDSASPRPEVVLLLQGVNDLGDDRLSVDDVVDSLRLEIQAAKTRGMKVMISTLTPIYVPNCVPAYPCRAGAAPFIAPANVGIRALAAAEGVILVDGFAAISRNAAADVAVDGLHLTRAGRQDLAQAFLDAIKTNFETAPAASRAWRAGRR